MGEGAHPHWQVCCQRGEVAEDPEAPGEMAGMSALLGGWVKLRGPYLMCRVSIVDSLQPFEHVVAPLKSPFSPRVPHLHCLLALVSPRVPHLHCLLALVGCVSLVDFP